MDDPPANFTVKPDKALRERIKRAMKASGATVWADFARVALLDRCRKIEAELKATHPEEYRKIYGSGP